MLDFVESVSEATLRVREKGGTGCTNLAIESAGVGNVFLGLVGIHWVGLVGF